MNPLVTIISGIINAVNAIIDNLDKRVAESIKQGFFFIIFLGIVGAVFLGYRMGSGSAKRFGIPLADTTNQVFEIDIKRLKERPQFNSLLENESIREGEKIDTAKLKFPSREGLEQESRDRVLEPDSLKKKPAPAYELDTRSRIAEIDRTEDKPRQSDVRDLPRREPLFEKDTRAGIVRENREAGNVKQAPSTSDDDATDQEITKKASTPRRELIKIRPSDASKTQDKKLRIIDR
jgi:hypothetical protein